ncbi:sialidase family protein [Singulisphaera sp. Ch08]|uniref:exo-alpha-sialidase n=1 Tax=Singulisphaera sp. Ch08 TaxID=3120278 RepID=A0AAU7CCL5_9BACT
MRKFLRRRSLKHALLIAWFVGSFGTDQNVTFAQTPSEATRGTQPAKSQRDGLTQLDIFVAGQDGYKSFRIPSLLVTPRGTVLAFCEGRKHTSGDSGDIDLVQRRSTDGGTTWGPLQVIADDGPHTMGNPCPVVDRETGTIWMLMTRNNGQDKEPQILDGSSRESRSVWVMKSSDEGLSWSPPVEITKQVKPPDWTWYATGPGVAIQLESGRIVVPCDHFLAKSKIGRSHVIYSDDHGATWKLGGVAGERVNECQVAELSDRTLVLNMRNHPPKRGQGRAISTSRDGGLTWTPPSLDLTLIEPGCQASLISLKDEQGRMSNRLLFSNPASAKRELMTVRLSDDGGRTWPRHKPLHAGPSAYSCLASLAGRGVGCLYERGERGPYERITLARFDLDWLASDPN